METNFEKLVELLNQIEPGEPMYQAVKDCIADNGQEDYIDPEYLKEFIDTYEIDDVYELENCIDSYLRFDVSIENVCDYFALHMFEKDDFTTEQIATVACTLYLIESSGYEIEEYFEEYL